MWKNTTFWLTCKYEYICTPIRWASYTKHNWLTAIYDFLLWGQHHAIENIYVDNESNNYYKLRTAVVSQQYVSVVLLEKPTFCPELLYVNVHQSKETFTNPFNRRENKATNYKSHLFHLHAAIYWYILISFINNDLCIICNVWCYRLGNWFGVPHISFEDQYNTLLHTSLEWFIMHRIDKLTKTPPYMF